MIHKINYHSNEYWGVIGMQAGDYRHVTNGERTWKKANPVVHP